MLLQTVTEQFWTLVMGYSVYVLLGAFIGLIIGVAQYLRGLGVQTL